MEYSLVADIYSLSRFGYFGDRWNDPQLIAHPDYEIGQPGGCEFCVMGWAKFTPYAAPDDVHRLMQLNLSCLTRWHPCTTQSDIMPTAWSQYLAERTNQRPLSETSGCPPVIVEILGRDSAFAAAGQVVRFDKVRSGDTVAIVRVLDQMKDAGVAAAWHVGELRTVSVLLDSPCAPKKLLTGMRLIFFGGFDRSNNRLMPSAPWPVVPMTGINLEMFRRGVVQDYAAMVQSSGGN